MPEVELPLLSPLIILAGLLFALGCVMLIDGFVRALFGAVASLFSHIPLVGSLTASAIHNAEHAISGALGKAVSGIESNIGRQWHNLARVLGNLWAEQKLIAQNLWHLAQGFYHFASLSDLRQWAHDLERLFRHSAGTISKAVTRELHGVERRIGRLERTLAHDAKRFAHAIDTTIPAEIGGLWGQTKALTDSIGRLWDRVRSIEGRISTAAIAAVVATVLASLGLDWLGCKDGASRTGRSGCNLWSELGDIFALLSDALIFSAICEVFPLLTSAFADVASPFVQALTTATKELCPPFPKSWAKLDVQTGPLPPSQATGQIAQ